MAKDLLVEEIYTTAFFAFMAATDNSESHLLLIEDLHLQGTMLSILKHLINAYNDPVRLRYYGH